MRAAVPEIQLLIVNHKLNTFYSHKAVIANNENVNLQCSCNIIPTILEATIDPNLPTTKTIQIDIALRWVGIASTITATTTGTSKPGRII